MTEMRILTVRQPWAWAIIHGGKDVENRVRNIAGDYRGPVAIHAAKANSHDDWVAMGKTDLAAYSDALNSFWSLVGGAIIGVVDLVSVHHSKRAETKTHAGQPVCFDDHTPIRELCSAWALAGPMWHLELSNPRSLSKPVAFKGALGLRRLDAGTIRQIEEQLA